MSWSVALSKRKRNVRATNKAHHPPALSTPAHHGFSATGWVAFCQPSLRGTMRRVRYKWFRRRILRGLGFSTPRCTVSPWNTAAARNGMCKRSTSLFRTVTTSSLGHCEVGVVKWVRCFTKHGVPRPAQARLIYRRPPRPQRLPRHPQWPGPQGPHGTPPGRRPRIRRAPTASHSRRRSPHESPPELNP